MIRYLLRCLLPVAFLFSYFNLHAQEDTVGFWKVTYNGKEIGAVTVNYVPTYMLDDESMTDSSKFNVYYYTEDPCDKCRCRLQVRDDGGITVKTIERKGYGNNVPFCITGKELLEWMHGGKGRIFLYFSGKYNGWMPWIFLGAVSPNVIRSEDPIPADSNLH